MNGPFGSLGQDRRRDTPPYPDPLPLQGRGNQLAGAGCGGGTSPDPYLLGSFSEAQNQDLVAGQEWPSGLRFSVVRGGRPHCVRRIAGTRVATD
jgi:hypothetical protein